MKNLYSLIFSKAHSQTLFFWTILFITGVLMSCGAPNAKFLAEVEKLEEIIKKSEQELQIVDTSKIGNYLRISNENLKFIQDNFKDTIDKETAILFSDYSASRKSLKMFLENYNDVMKELSYSKTQLYSMKTDIDNNLMPEDKFTDYYSSESKSVEKLRELAQNLVQWYDSALKMYEAKSPSMEKIISGIKKNQESVPKPTS